MSKVKKHNLDNELRTIIERIENDTINLPTYEQQQDIKQDTETILSKITEASGGGGNGVIKQVQRGYTKKPATSDSGDYSNLNISLATVDPSKCLVIVDAIKGPTYNAAFKSLTSNELTIAITGYYSNFQYYYDYVSWQVIEFY